jgi:hypothetical protein
MASTDVRGENRMGIRSGRLGRLLMLALVVLPSPPLGAEQEPKMPPNMTLIDGKKNPESIPEHNVWLSVFRTFAEGVQILPDGVAEYVPPAESALIFTEAKRLQKFWSDCTSRLLKAREPLYALEQAGAEPTVRFAKARELDFVMWEIELACRWETLHTRDRLLEQLNIKGRTALKAWTESRKAGTKLFIPRAGLERYRQPQ